MVKPHKRCLWLPVNGIQRENEKSNRWWMENPGDVIRRMKPAYIDGCVCAKRRSQHGVRVLFLESHDKIGTGMMNGKRILRTLPVMMYFFSF